MTYCGAMALGASHDSLAEVPWVNEERAAVTACAGPAAAARDHRWQRWLRKHAKRSVTRTRQDAGRVVRRIALRPRRVGEAEVRREELSVRYLRGDGIEIGALHRPMWVPPGVRVRYVDNASREQLVEAVTDVDPAIEDAVRVDVVDDGRELATFSDASLNFVIANHVLEHLEDPVVALSHWLRVLRPGGVLLLTLPDARHTFDAPRERTTVKHVLRDHREGPEVSREDHLTEYARLAEHVPDERIAERVTELAQAPWPIHFHVWELESFLELLLALELPACIEAAQAVAPEFSVVLRKHAPTAA